MHAGSAGAGSPSARPFFFSGGLPPPPAASLSTPRLRALIVFLSSNLMTHRGPVRLTPLWRSPYSYSLIPQSSRLVDGSNADGDVDRMHGLSVSRPSVTPRQHDN